MKLNDQDIFNVVFALHPGMLRVLSCDWNVQYHARLNTMMACYGEESERRAQVPCSSPLLALLAPPLTPNTTHHHSSAPLPGPPAADRGDEYD